jgi:signal peptidase I
MTNSTSEQPPVPEREAESLSGEPPPTAEAAESESSLWSGGEEGAPTDAGGPYPPPVAKEVRRPPHVRLSPWLLLDIGLVLLVAGLVVTIGSRLLGPARGVDVVWYGAVLAGVACIVGGLAVIAGGRKSIEAAIPVPSARVVRELVETFVLALLIFLAVRATLQNFRVEGSSMDPVLHNGQYLIVNKAIYTRINLKTISKFLPFIDAGDSPVRYLFRAPRRGDVVVFRFPGNPDRDFIKRIIGEPGDTVEVRDGTVYVNGGPLDEPYITSKPTYVYGPTEVPPHQYFALGDNRNNSYDSHVWGFLPEENIIGQAWLSYWPKDDWGLILNKDLSPQAP